MFLSCFVWLITFSFLVFYTLIFILLNISLVSVLTLRNLFYDCRILRVLANLKFVFSILFSNLTPTFF